MEKVQVLLASYNGGSFIEEQIESILSQENVIISLMIRDDGSNDGSIERIQDLYKSDDRIVVVQNRTTKKGHLNNFSALCDLGVGSDADYFAFSDQDDRWHVNKLSKCLSRLKEIELKQSKETPVLIHSDLRVVDQDLKEIAPSFIRYQGIPEPDRHQHETFLHQNVATGCTFLFNRALLSLAAPVPFDAVIHDWWFALVAKFYGVIEFIDTPLIDYRQHESNSIGAISASEQRNLFNGKLIKALLKYPSHLAASVEQAKQLLSLSQVKPNIDIDTLYLKKISQFSTLKEQSFIERVKYVNATLAGHKPIEERLYFYVVLFIIPWIKD
ncbi:glycosyltransferase family 2 protein [Shewanella aestuarii]|uniref:Glycosyltransferase family 2 protein n=1 Tax=Shewanella aestuarii TaxID=1028752 RepID=A0A6G9QKQ8_9GAMM|nr:glycosyltransferase family 2 protein [Shewanella aestuarii]QIR15116.1 glycosyltransferase family 2 protein [Shewanella aestuarii]